MDLNSRAPWIIAGEWGKIHYSRRMGTTCQKKTKNRSRTKNTNPAYSKKSSISTPLAVFETKLEVWNEWKREFLILSHTPRAKQSIISTTRQLFAWWVCKKRQHFTPTSVGLWTPPPCQQQYGLPSAVRWFLLSAYVMPIYIVVIFLNVLSEAQNNTKTRQEATQK